MNVAQHHPPMNPFPPDPILVDTLDRLLSKTCTHAEVQLAETEGWSSATWDALAQLGAPWIGLGEAAGGSGGTIADAAAVLQACGSHAAPVPIAETGLLGGWLAAQAGLELPDGPLTVVPGRPGDTLTLDGDELSGVAQGVAWARAASLIFAVVGDRLVWFAPTDGTLRRRTNLAGEPRDTVELSNVSVSSTELPPSVNASTLRLRGAFTRACLMTGAMEQVTSITIAYTNERRQFGRPVSTFQAVGQHLVRAASETQLALIALRTAIAAIEHRGFEGAAFEIASLKAVAGEAADVVTSRCHQAHGAIGMTQEYVLHQLTRRLWSWREEYGSTTWWRQEVGRLASAYGSGPEPDALWRLIVRGSSAPGIERARTTVSSDD